MEKREYSLDVIKIIATILIVFHHYQQTTGAMFRTINFFNGRIYVGYIVELFFVLSGYFMWRYVEVIDDAYSFKRYMLRRLQRLLPLVAISAIVYEILVIAYQTIYGQLWFDTKVTLWGTIIDALGIQDGWGLANPCVNNPTWYISVLIWCYIVFFCLTRLSKITRIPYWYFYGFMVMIGMGITTYSINLPFLNQSMARGYYAFFFGVLLGGYCADKERLSVKSQIICLLVLASLTLMAVFQYEMVSDGFQYILTFFFYPSLIIVFNSALLKRMFRFPMIGTVGKISFNVYIWHVPMFLVMYIFIKLTGININTTSFKGMILFTISVFFVGTISHFCIEKPINKAQAHFVIFCERKGGI